MRIAMVGRYYNRQGGVSAVIAELSDRAGADHEVDVYASEALDTDASPARFVHVPMVERPPWLQVPTFAWRLRAFLDRRRYDIVHVHDAQGLDADVLTSHSCAAAWFDVARREVGFPKSLLSRVYPPHVASTTWERFALRRSEAPIIAVSGRTAEELTRYVGVDPARIHVIYNGIDTARFSPAVVALGRAGAGRGVGGAPSGGRARTAVRRLQLQAQGARRRRSAPWRRPATSDSSCGSPAGMTRRRTSGSLASLA